MHLREDVVVEAGDRVGAAREREHVPAVMTQWEAAGT
jgi:hypothetical protein